MTMPENTNIFNCEQVREKLISCLDKQEIISQPEYQPVFEHLSNCESCREYFAFEQNFENDLIAVIKKSDTADEQIWQRTRELLDDEFQRTVTRQRIRYFVSVSVAAAIFIAVIGYLLFLPQDIPSNLLSAMEKEHLSLIQETTKLPGFNSPEELSDYFRKEKLLAEKECFCNLFDKNKDLRLRTGRTGSLSGCPCAVIYAEYQDIPVSVFIFNPSPGLIAQKGSLYPIREGIEKRGEFYVGIKRLPSYFIGIIGKIDETTLTNLLKNIDTLSITDDCRCGCK